MAQSAIMIGARQLQPRFDWRTFWAGSVHSTMRLAHVRPILFLGAILILIPLGKPHPVDSPEVPVVDAGLGSCRADFTVKDGAAKPIYNAKVTSTIKYGFLSKRKTELEVGTNSDGKARITGLPNLPKKPLEFSIKSGTVSTTVTDDPSTNCNAVFDVTLTVR
jgi:hypothetical protein